MAERERKNHIHFYLSDDELVILKAKMREAQTNSISQFYRNLTLYSNIYYVEFDDIREMNTELGKIGNNINQIAKKMNENGNVYRDDVREVKERQERIWQLLKSILSKLP
ncbi:MAG: MobC family plasmid mobilization relaxosome protein [Lachnospiraceae bacterium]|nr:MobC family plasmid mobilization relaxosome protein [Lachnospiraceae bacterium]